MGVIAYKYQWNPQTGEVRLPSTEYEVWYKKMGRKEGKVLRKGFCSKSILVHISFFAIDLVSFRRINTAKKGVSYTIQSIRQSDFPVAEFSTFGSKNNELMIACDRGAVYALSYAPGLHKVTKRRRFQLQGLEEGRKIVTFSFCPKNQYVVFSTSINLKYRTFADDLLIFGVNEKSLEFDLKAKCKVNLLKDPSDMKKIDQLIAWKYIDGGRYLVITGFDCSYPNPHFVSVYFDTATSEAVVSIEGVSSADMVTNSLQVVGESLEIVTIYGGIQRITLKKK